MDSTYFSDSDNNTTESDSGDRPPSGTTLAVDDMDLDEENPHSAPNVADTDTSTAITALLLAYSSLSVPQLLGLLAPNFTHRVLPESLGMPTRDKQAFAQHAAGIFSVFESFRMRPSEVLKAAGRRETWVVRARMEGVLKGGRGAWENECVLIIKMDDRGTLVEEIQEFVDSAKALEMKRRHAPKDFGGEAPRAAAAAAAAGVGATPAAAFVAAFCWFVVCVLVAKTGAVVLALAIFWAHPVLEAFRRSFSQP